MILAPLHTTTPPQQQQQHSGRASIRLAFARRAQQQAAPPTNAARTMASAAVQQQQQHGHLGHHQEQQHPSQQQQQQQQAAHGASAAAEARIAYAARMRQLFSPPGMLQPDGAINQDFFRPRTVLTVLADRKWGDAEREALLRGLAKHGVGRWRQMSKDMLPGWDDTTIRLKAAKLLGCQNLSRYHGRTLSAADVAAEHEANRALGAATGCWKHGMLVDDAAGTLAAHWRRQQEEEEEEEAAGQ